METTGRREGTRSRGGEDRRRRPAMGWTLVALLAVVAACSGGEAPVAAGNPGAGDDELICAINQNWLASGAGRGGIPNLDDPRLVAADHWEADYVFDGEPVVGLLLEEGPVAIPHQILWWHEIVNLDRASAAIAVTHCPLTGSSLVFRRDVVGGDPFIVSGLLYYNNLILATRDGETLFSQMLSKAVCGPGAGTSMEREAAMEMTWSAWKELYPDTRVVAVNTGIPRPYTSYPYDDYRDLDDERTLFPMPELDDRRPPKERVLGIPDGQVGGLAIPFGELAATGDRAVVPVEVDGREIVVFWSSEAEAALAYRPVAEGAPGGPPRLTFRVEDGAFVDTETGSRWRLDGRAVDGPLTGARLEPVDEAYVAFWFAWAVFQPSTGIWRPDAG